MSDASATTAHARGKLGPICAALALGFAALAGCGPERPPAEGTGGWGGGAGGGKGFETDAGPTLPPGCGAAPDGSYCECLDAPLYGDPPTIYFVLDRSGSMAADDKWTQVRVTVGKIMRGLGPRAAFGATVFPGISSGDACAPGDEVMAVRPGDPPSSGVDGDTTTALLAATRVVPYGGTPTAPTLERVRERLMGVEGQRYVILATDGAPNCNAALACGFDQCQINLEDYAGCPKEGPRNCCEPPDGLRENCSDEARTLTAIAKLKDAGIPVYVVGLPGSAHYAGLLDQMATAGGAPLAASPRYFAVDSASEGAMLDALKKVAAEITGTCVFELRAPPADPALVNVYLDDVVLPYEPVNGWTIDGATVTLVGSACARVERGDVLDVRVIAGCPRTEPK